MNREVVRVLCSLRLSYTKEGEPIVLNRVRTVAKTRSY